MTDTGRGGSPLRSGCGGGLMQVDFYHLVRSPIDRVLPRIAERIYDQGGRLVIVSADAEQRQAIDRLLWSYAADSFLPHAQEGAGDDARQPILIADRVNGANGARNVAIIDGQWRDDAMAFDRAFHFFDEGGIQAARGAWKGLASADGIERRYWRQTESGWEQAA